MNTNRLLAVLAAVTTVVFLASLILYAKPPSFTENVTLCIFPYTVIEVPANQSLPGHIYALYSKCRLGAGCNTSVRSVKVCEGCSVRLGYAVVHSFWLKTAYGSVPPAYMRSLGNGLIELRWSWRGLGLDAIGYMRITIDHLLVASKQPLPWNMLENVNVTRGYHVYRLDWSLVKGLEAVVHRDFLREVHVEIDLYDCKGFKVVTVYKQYVFETVAFVSGFATIVTLALLVYRVVRSV